jgi:hypothetical protein
LEIQEKLAGQVWLRASYEVVTQVSLLGVIRLPFYLLRQA